MSENFPSAVILTKTQLETAIEILGQSLEMVVDEFDFGFRNFGAAVQLIFEGGRYDEDLIDEQLVQRDFTRQTVERLAQHYGWFALQGTIRIPDVDRLCSLDAVLYPTSDPEQPASAIFRLDSWFFESLFGRSMDQFHQDAANLLVKLSVALGANRLSDGFTTIPLPSLARVRVPDAAFLRRALLEPDLSAEAFDIANAGLACRPGLVIGIKSALVSRAEIQIKWPDATVLQTINGFSVLSTLAPIPGEIGED